MTRDVLFDSHPDSMFIYAVDDLRILAVNDAAVERYEYSRAEFLRMTIRDIRPSEDVPRLEHLLSQSSDHLKQAGIWRHRKRSGEVFFVDIASRGVEYEGKAARLVTARDVTHLLELERENADLLDRERGLRREAQNAAARFQSLFESAPGRFVVLTPRTYEIVAVSDAYLEATMTRREDIIGRPLFDVFPRDPSDPLSTGVDKVRASLARVEATGVPDVMHVQRYPIPIPDHAGGGFEERYWNPVNSPVLGSDGSVTLIIHRTEDVTDFVRDVQDSAARELAGTGESEVDLDASSLDILLRSRDLRVANERLLEHEANLRTAKRLLGIGLWKMDVEREQLTWSDDVYEMYGIPRSASIDLKAYIDLVHPDEQEEMATAYARFLQSGGVLLKFQHRVRRPDGRVIHVRGLGERAEGFEGKMLTGVVQDITDQIAAAERLSDATEMLRIAGRAAKLGGWRVDLEREVVAFSEETALIHGFPPAPVEFTIDETLSFYESNYQEEAVAAFERAIRTGEDFDLLLPLKTVLGHSIWVRATGEVERNHAGAVVGLRGSFQDVSELLEARLHSEALAERLHSTLESISDGFCTIDPEWKFTYVNQEFSRIIGVKQDDCLGRIVWECFPDARRFRPLLEAALTSREKVHFDEYHEAIDKWLRVSAYPTDEGLAVYLQDVTALRRQEEKIRLLESAIAQQRDMLVITEAAPIDAPDGPKIVFVNDAFIRHTGYSEEEAVGQTPRMLQGPRTQKQELARIRAALEKDESVRAELINYTKAGEEFWLEIDIAPLVDDRGQTTNFLAVQRDITERKAIEEGVRLSEERFATLARVTNDVIWDWDLRANRVWWNDSFRTQFGYDPNVVESGPESWYDRIHPDDRHRVIEGIHHVIDGGGSNWLDEYRFTTAHGREVAVIDRGSVIRDEAGEPIRMIGSMVDITEKREMDERLRQSQRLEAIGQLTGGVAHDFNNLLTVILGNVELLRENVSRNPELLALSESSVAAAERGAELTNRLLAFARRQALEPRLIELKHLLQSMSILIRRTLGEDIDIEIVAGDDLWDIFIDTGQLEVALLNLAINARDAMPGGGRLTIEARNKWIEEEYAADHVDVTTGPHVMISVSDTGTGMPQAVIDRAFEPFFTTKEVGRGSGLGLSMVYGFVKQSQGHVKIYSEEGSGTSVKIYFPRATESLEEPAAQSAVEKPVGGHEHVLVVEDDDLVRRHVIMLLSDLGYTVTAAASGPEALALLRTDAARANLLFTDIVMPKGMNGRELADAAREIRPDLKVLYTSGYPENALVHHGRLDPGIALLSKPYRRQELADKLRAVLDSRA